MHILGKWKMKNKNKWEPERKGGKYSRKNDIKKQSTEF